MSTPRAKRSDLLPAHQLAAAVDRMIARADAPRILFCGNVANDQYSSGPNIRAGLGINERVHYGWRGGDRPTVGLHIADMILCRSGLCWWDVWNEDTVRLPILKVTTYTWRTKGNRQGRRIRCRVVKSTVRYGDLGTDWDTLRHVRDLWEPADMPAEVAA